MALYRNRNSVEVQGIKELQIMFRSLPKQLNDQKIFNKFFRENSKPLIKEAKANINRKANKTGQLARSIGYFTTKKTKKYLGGFVGPRVKGRFASSDKTGFYGPFIEYGDEVKFFGKGPMPAAKPFFEPAFQTTKFEMLNNTIKDAEKTIAKLIKQHAKRTEKYGRLGR